MVSLPGTNPSSPPSPSFYPPLPPPPSLTNLSLSLSVSVSLSLSFHHPAHNKKQSFLKYDFYHIVLIDRKQDGSPLPIIIFKILYRLPHPFVIPQYTPDMRVSPVRLISPLTCCPCCSYLCLETRHISPCLGFLNTYPVIQTPELKRTLEPSRSKPASFQHSQHYRHPTSPLYFQEWGSRCSEKQHSVRHFNCENTLVWAEFLYGHWSIHPTGPFLYPRLICNKSTCSVTEWVCNVWKPLLCLSLIFSVPSSFAATL